jgi:hypothetical protein
MLVNLKPSINIRQHIKNPRSNRFELNLRNGKFLDSDNAESANYKAYIVVQIAILRYCNERA